MQYFDFQEITKSSRQ